MRFLSQSEDERDSRVIGDCETGRDLRGARLGRVRRIYPPDPAVLLATLKMLSPEESVFVKWGLHDLCAAEMPLGSFIEHVEELVALDPFSVWAGDMSGMGWLTLAQAVIEPFDYLKQVYGGAIYKSGVFLHGAAMDDVSEAPILSGDAQLSLRANVLDGPFADQWILALEHLGSGLNEISRSSVSEFDLRLVVNVDGSERVLEEEPSVGITHVQGRGSYFEIGIQVEQERIERTDDLRETCATAVALAFSEMGADGPNFEQTALGFIDRAFEGIPSLR